jgi:hypothetical protein
MSAIRAFRLSPPTLAVLLGLASAACSSTAGPAVVGPSGGATSNPATGVEGIVFLTHDLSSENVPVFLIWTEQEQLSAPGGGELQVVAVPVGEGETPPGAQVRVTRTDSQGHFQHAQALQGGASLRVGALPTNCRRPNDLRVQLAAGELKQVRIDVLCYGPKPPPLK